MFNRVFYQSDIQMGLEFATLGEASSATNTPSLHVLRQLLTERLQYSRFKLRPSFFLSQYSADIILRIATVNLPVEPTFTTTRLNLMIHPNSRVPSRCESTR